MLLEQSFTAYVPLLKATGTYQFGRRCWNCDTCSTSIPYKTTPWLVLHWTHATFDVSLRSVADKHQFRL